jgi:pyruvate dehydrogenase E1 component
MLPLYIFYSMFGFQRTGDSIWSAADQRSKGFLIGATAGRTTLNGEGLQHEDGHSILLAASNPGVVTYDPSFAFEIACVVEDGVNRMLGEAGEDVLYYLSVYNEPVPQPAMPDHVSEEDVVRGIYRYAKFEEGRSHRAQLLASGSAMTQAIEAQRLLGEDWDVAADLWSVPGWVGLHREALAASGHNLVHPEADPRVPVVTQVLEGAGGPFIAVTDYQRAVPGLIAPWIPGPYATLGTDGFGRSDTRPALRRLFRIDAAHIVVAVLSELAEAGEVKRETVTEALRH